MKLHKATVSIVDNDIALREDLDMFLCSNGIKTQAYACDKSFIEQYEPKPPECLLLDIGKPKTDGVKLLETLKSELIEIPVIFTTKQSCVSLIVEVIKAGAFEFLQKPFDNNELLRCVLKALKSDQDRYSYCKKMQNTRKRLQSLTARERQVLDGVLAGRQTKVIAADLALSSRTIDGYRASMMRKMQAKSPVELLTQVSNVNTFWPRWNKHSIRR